VYADDELGVMHGLHNAYPDWKPRGVVDVGANIGGWTTQMQEEIFPGVKTFMVEASPSHTQELEETKKKFAPDVVDYQIAVLSSMDGDTVEFFSGGYSGTGNSIFQEQSKHFKGIKPDLRTTAKLDTLVKKMEHIDYLKLDVQGAELIVLSGATETLKKTTFVQLEVSVIEYNKGGACWHEIDELLRQHGFHFYDSTDYIINENAFHTKAMGQFDVLYIKPSSNFMPKWLVDNNVTFCGSSRAGGQAEGKDNKEKKNVRSTMVFTNTMDSEQHILHAMIGVGTFLAGYLVGRRKTKSIGKMQ